uniref:Uncharacterized protein n=1 Tax=Pararge aegeria TaxID=116150 RepID=S4P8H3_9NEOP
MIMYLIRFKNLNCLSYTLTICNYAGAIWPFIWPKAFIYHTLSLQSLLLCCTYVYSKGIITMLFVKGRHKVPLQ